MPSLIETTSERAVDVLTANTTEDGLRASRAYYNQIWARDSMISFLGVNCIQDEVLTDAAKATLRLFARSRSPLGQIPNFYDTASRTPEFGFSGSTDSSCWYIIGLANLLHASGDRALLKAPLAAALDSYRWLRHQDANNTWLIDSPQGGDWMDAAVQRTGKTLYNNILFLMATKSLESLLSASGLSLERRYRLDWEALKQRFQDVFLPDTSSPRRIAMYWPRLSSTLTERRPLGLSQEYYLHFISFARLDARFDTLSNLLCILSGVASPKTARSVIDAIRRKNLSRPYPVRNLHPAYGIREASFDAGFDATLPAQHQSVPYAYHNGAVWPFVGGFYVCALYREGIEWAPGELEKLAQANRVLKPGENIGFNEWLHGKTGEALGQYGQSWNAGMFLAACASSKRIDPFGFLR